MTEFDGFPSGSQKTPIPNVFFTTLLPKIKDIAELKIVLHVFWGLFNKKGHPRFVTFRELLGDKTLAPGLGEGFREKLEALDRGLNAAVDKGILVTTEVEAQGLRHRLYFLNTESDRRAVDRIENGDLDLGAMPVTIHAEAPRPDVFSLYEANIGELTPLVSEELIQALALYPEEWVIDAIHEAVKQAARSWSYIEAILKSWKLEGRHGGEPRRHTEKREDTDKYFQGRYGHLVRRRLT